MLIHSRHISMLQLEQFTAFLDDLLNGSMQMEHECVVILRVVVVIL